MRCILNGIARNGVGHIVPSATVSVYLTGTTTAASIYTTLSSTTAVNSVTAATDGTFTLYVDRFDYDRSQCFDIAISKSGYDASTWSNVNISEVVLGTYTISTDKTVTTDLGYIPKGVIYSVSSGKTLTISGSFDAGIYQIFSGTGLVTFSGVIDQSRPEWFATNTTPGTTDMTAAIQAAINAHQGGGKVKFLAKKYLVSDEISLISGTNLEGAGNADFHFGSPRTGTLQTHIYQSTAGKAIFLADATSTASVTDWRIADMSLFGLATPTHLTASADKIGVRMVAETGYVQQRITFERVSFYNFAVGISVIDPTEGTGTDSSISGVSVRNCVFYANTKGAYFKDDNADVWIWDSCHWYMAADQIGVDVATAGFMTFINCSGGGWVSDNNGWLSLTGKEFDNIKVINSQFETLTYTLYIHADIPDSSDMNYRQIVFDTCAVEADIIFECAVHFVSAFNRYADGVSVTGSADYTNVDSYSDTFLDGTANTFVISGTQSRVRNMIAPKFYNAYGPTGTVLPYGVSIINGRRETVGIAVPTSGAWNTRDIVWFNAPAAGSPIGWVCTAGGTPGTWVPFGMIQAATATTEQLADSTHAINTTNKYTGKVVYNTTTNLLVTASGAAATSHWYSAAGADTHTPTP